MTKSVFLSYFFRKWLAKRTVATNPTSLALSSNPLLVLLRPNAFSSTVICEDKYTVTLCDTIAPIPNTTQKGTRLRNSSVFEPAPVSTWLPALFPLISLPFATSKLSSKSVVGTLRS